MQASKNVWIERPDRIAVQVRRAGVGRVYLISCWLVGRKKKGGGAILGRRLGGRVRQSDGHGSELSWDGSVSVQVRMRLREGYPWSFSMTLSTFKFSRMAAIWMASRGYIFLIRGWMVGKHTARWETCSLPILPSVPNPSCSWAWALVFLFRINRSVFETATRLGDWCRTASLTFVVKGKRQYEMLERWMTCSVFLIWKSTFSRVCGETLLFTWLHFTLIAKSVPKEAITHGRNILYEWASAIAPWERI